MFSRIGAFLTGMLLYGYPQPKEVGMARKKALKAGDIVFAVDVRGKVIEAAIRSVDKKAFLPYELALNTKARFYPREDLFLTREEAAASALSASSKRFHDATAKGQNFIGDQDAEYDEKTHTFLNPKGERISEFFEAPQEVLDQYNQRIKDVMVFCEEHSLPFFGVMCPANHKKGTFGLCLTTILPGPRTPEIFDILEEVVHQAMGKK